MFPDDRLHGGLGREEFGRSVLHDLVPPHPGPLIAIDALRADLGLALALGLLVAVPTVVIAWPLFARVAERSVGPLEVPAAIAPMTA